jgi:hypothetical protein
VSEPAFDPVPLLAALQRHGVDFIVVGAAAAVSQGSPLPTYDLEVTPARNPQNIERIIAALAEVAFPIDSKTLSGGEAWTFATSSGPLDLVFVPAGTKGYGDLRRDALSVDLGTGEPVLVASLRDVIRMKEASSREKDRAQLPALRRTLELIREREREGREPT